MQQYLGAGIFLFLVGLICIGGNADDPSGCARAVGWVVGLVAAVIGVLMFLHGLGVL